MHARHSLKLLCALGCFAAAAAGGPAQAATPFGAVRSPHAFARHAHPPAQSGPAGFAAMKVNFGKTVIGDQGFVIASYAKTYGISTIFLTVAGDDISLLEAHDPVTVSNLQAIFNVANVYILTGDPSWLNNPTTVPAAVTALVRNVAPAYPQFAGILYEIEPQATQRTAYFQLLNTLFGGSQPYAFGNTMLEVKPNWWALPNSSGGGSPSWLQQAENYPAVSSLYLDMNGNSASAQMTWDVSKALPQLDKPFWSGADAITMRGNSYYDVTPSYLQTNLTSVGNQLSKLSPLYAGISVDAWAPDNGGLAMILPQMPPQVPRPIGPLVPPAGSIYLGAYVAPPGSPLGPTTIAAFEATIGRKLAYDLHFHGFLKSIVGRDTTDDLENGRIPMIAWDCSVPDAQIASGAEDAHLKSVAAQAAAFGHPIFLRFLWEMNLPVGGARKVCWDPNTDLPGNVLSPVYYKAAWRHMHDIFVAAGATNVIWVWNPSGPGPSPSEYYPGADVVDWVGIDDYDLTSVSFARNSGPVLDSFAQYGKPIVISETGAQPTYQPTYLSQIGGVLSQSYPMVMGVSYFDSNAGLRAKWTLTSPGIAAFAAMGAQPYFSAVPPNLGNLKKRP